MVFPWIIRSKLRDKKTAHRVELLQSVWSEELCGNFSSRCLPCRSSFVWSPASSNSHTLIMFNLEDPLKRLEGKRHSAQTMVECVLISLYTPGNLNDHFLRLCKRKSQHEWKLLMWDIMLSWTCVPRFNRGEFSRYIESSCCCIHTF